MKRRISKAFLLAMIVSVLCGRMVHFVQHPEYTEPEALVYLWPFWTLAAACFLAALTLTYYRVNRTK